MLNSLREVLHVARALSEITGCRELVVVGSAAVIAARGRLEGDHFGTEDVDVFALDGKSEDDFTDEAELIGLSSRFHETFGYYADGVGERTAIMPMDWKSRATKYPVPAVSDTFLWIPDSNDVALAKLCAWREKDQDWLKAAVGSDLVEWDVMASRLSGLIQTDHTPPTAELTRRLNSLR